MIQQYKIACNYMTQFSLPVDNNRNNHTEVLFHAIYLAVCNPKNVLQPG